MKNITDQLVSFKTAKLAKENGFKENTACWYNDTEPDVIRTSAPMCHNLYNGIIAVPTQSLLQRWLREVHNIDIFINYESFNNKNQYFGQIYSNLVEEEEDDAIYFNTYEEALEDALYDSLIIIP